MGEIAEILNTTPANVNSYLPYERIIYRMEERSVEADRQARYTGRIHDEAGLRALDAILYGPVREIKELTDEVAEEMAAEFEKLHPDFRYDHLEIHTDE